MKPTLNHLGAMLDVWHGLEELCLAQMHAILCGLRIADLVCQLEVVVMRISQCDLERDLDGVHGR